MKPGEFDENAYSDDVTHPDIDDALNDTEDEAVSTDGIEGEEHMVPKLATDGGEIVDNPGLPNYGGVPIENTDGQEKTAEYDIEIENNLIKEKGTLDSMSDEDAITPPSLENTSEPEVLKSGIEVTLDAKLAETSNAPAPEESGTETSEPIAETETLETAQENVVPIVSTAKEKIEIEERHAKHKTVAEVLEDPMLENASDDEYNMNNVVIPITNNGQEEKQTAEFLKEKQKADGVEESLGNRDIGDVVPKKERVFELDESKTEDMTADVPQKKEKESSESLQEKMLDLDVYNNGFSEFGISEEDLTHVENFEQLTMDQKAMVAQNLKQLTLGRIINSSKDEFKKSKKEANLLVGMWKGITKNYQLADLRKKNLEEIEVGGMDIHGDILHNLVQGALKGPGVELIDGKVNINYISQHENLNTEEGEKIKAFNNSANLFGNIPDEWGYKKDGVEENHLERASSLRKGKGFKTQYEQYEEAKYAYDQARNGLKELSKEKTGEDKQAYVEKLAEAHKNVMLNRHLNTHPEVEKELQKIDNESAVWAGLKDSLTSQGMYFGAGFAMRTASVGMLGFAAIPTVGGIIGRWRARNEAKENLQDNLDESRRGNSKLVTLKAQLKDAQKARSSGEENDKEVKYLENEVERESKISRHFVTAESLVNKLEMLQEQLDEETDINKRERLIQRTKSRLHDIETKKEEGLVDYSEHEFETKNKEDLEDVVLKSTVEIAGIETNEDDNAWSETATERTTAKRLKERKIIDEIQKNFVTKEGRKGFVKGAIIAGVLGAAGRHAADYISDKIDLTKFLSAIGVGGASASSISAAVLEDAGDNVSESVSETVVEASESVDVSHEAALAINSESDIQTEEAVTEEGSPVEDVIEAPEPIIHEVEKGENTWKITENYLRDSGQFNGIEDDTAAQNELINKYNVALLSASKEELIDVGFSSGNPHQLDVKDNLNFEKIEKLVENSEGKNIEQITKYDKEAGYNRNPNESGFAEKGSSYEHVATNQVAEEIAQHETASVADKAVQEQVETVAEKDAESVDEQVQEEAVKQDIEKTEVFMSKEKKAVWIKEKEAAWKSKYPLLPPDEINRLAKNDWIAMRNTELVKEWGREPGVINEMNGTLDGEPIPEHLQEKYFGKVPGGGIENIVTPEHPTGASVPETQQATETPESTQKTRARFKIVNDLYTSEPATVEQLRNPEFLKTHELNAADYKQLGKMYPKEYQLIEKDLREIFSSESYERQRLSLLERGEKSKFDNILRDQREGLGDLRSSNRNKSGLSKVWGAVREEAARNRLNKTSNSFRLGQNEKYSHGFNSEWERGPRAIKYMRVEDVTDKSFTKMFQKNVNLIERKNRSQLARYIGDMVKDIPNRHGEAVQDYLYRVAGIRSGGR